MPEESEPRTLVQCGKCGRAVWSDHVNKVGNCVTCSPPKAATEDVPEKKGDK
jgi:hypothetical protein